jgi:glutamate synthase domain-containing protein 1
LVGIPHSFFKRVVKEDIGIELGPLNSYGTGIVFLPQNNEAALAATKEVFESQVKQQGFNVIGWRRVETGKLF